MAYFDAGSDEVFKSSDTLFIDFLDQGAPGTDAAGEAQLGRPRVQPRRMAPAAIRRARDGARSTGERAVWPTHDGR